MQLRGGGAAAVSFKFLVMTVAGKKVFFFVVKKITLEKLCLCFH